MTEADPLETLHATLEEDPNVEMDLIVSARIRRRGGPHTVRFERLVRCPHCTAESYRKVPGCDACHRGLLPRSEKLDVLVPAGIAVGTKLRIQGKGHETLGGATGSLLLAIAPPPPVVRPGFRRARAVLERLRPTLSVIVLALGALGLIGAGLWLAQGANDDLAPVGSPCSDSRDCRSGDCLALWERPTFDFEGQAVPLPPRRSGAVCTTACETDADCPTSMRCVPVERRVSAVALPPGDPNASACAPNPTP
jgi:hypothetical protein